MMTNRPAVPRFMDDSDLKTPLHDEMMFWVDQHIVEIIRMVECRWDEEMVNSLHMHVRKAIDHALDAAAERRMWTEGALGLGEKMERLPDLFKDESEEEPVFEQDMISIPQVVAALRDWPGLGPLPPVPNAEILEVVWQSPVQDERGALVGFVDLEVHYDIPRLTVAHIISPHGWHDHWILTSLGRLRGNPFPSEVALPEWDTESPWYDDTTQVLCIDIRTAIPSLGALLREIRTYKAYGPGATFAVVSPDDQFAEVLEGQGIKFVKYEPEQAAK